MGFNPLKSIKRAVKAIVPDKIEHIVNTNVRGLGRTSKKLAPYVSMVNPVLGGAMGVGGSVAAGGNMEDHLNAGKQAAVGMIAGKVGGGLLKKLPGASKVGGALSKIPGADKVAGAVQKIGGLPGVNKVDDILKAGMGKVGGIDGVGGVGMDDLLALGAGAESAYNTVQAGRMRGKMVGAAEDSYNERKPLRAMGVAGMQNEVAPDLGGVFGDAGNPYYKPLARRAR